MHYVFVPCAIARPTNFVVNARTFNLGELPDARILPGAISSLNLEDKLAKLRSQEVEVAMQLPVGCQSGHSSILQE